MLFNDKKLDKLKKISDYLFCRLESTSSSSLLQETVVKKEEEPSIMETGKINAGEIITEPAAGETAPSVHMDSVNRDKASPDLELIKVEITRMAASTKIVQETTHHINEKVLLLEHKLNKIV